jgi:hypothetical protein
MVSPLQTGKQSVNLAAGGVRVSKIRRDPPPAVKELVVPDRDGRDARIVVIGIAAFALALFIIVIGFVSVSGWSPSQYTVQVGDRAKRSAE